MKNIQSFYDNLRLRDFINHAKILDVTKIKTNIKGENEKKLPQE